MDSVEERFQFSGFADEIAPELEEQMRVFQQLGIRYIEMRGVNGRSLCDYSLQEAKEIKEQDRITIRGKGRFCIKAWVRNTKSGRDVLKIEKYV